MKLSDSVITIGLLLLASIAAALGIGHALGAVPGADANTAVLLAVAMACLILRDAKKVKIGDVTIEMLEKKVEALDADLSQVKVEEQQLAMAAPTSAREPVDAAPVRSPVKAVDDALGDYDPRALDADWNSDPNKGRFGPSEANARRLEAQIIPLGNKTSAGCRVRLVVRSTDPQRPLVDPVKIYLHPTFGRWAVYEIKPKDGVARDEFRAWGAFTVGAVTDGGKTRLELDLAKVEGGTPRFYES